MTFATVDTSTLQAELDQPMAPFYIDAPGGRVRIDTRGSDYSLEMRGYRSDSEGRESWVGAGVTVYLPRFQGWGEEGFKEAYVSHSSSSPQGILGDTEITVELLKLACDIRDQLNNEAPIALAPIARAYEEQRARYEAEAGLDQQFRVEQRTILEAAAVRGKLRVYTAARKTPYQVGTIAATKVTEYGTEKIIPFKQITRVEIQLNESGKFGRYNDLYFPMARS